MVDFNLDNNDIPSKNRDIDLIIQQINLLFDTSKKEILGQSEFGTQYDNYLYNLNISNEALRQEVLSDLRDLNLFGFTPYVNVYLMQGTEKDIALVDINLIRDDEKYQKIYKIS